MPWLQRHGRLQHVEFQSEGAESFFPVRFGALVAGSDRHDAYVGHKETMRRACVTNKDAALSAVVPPAHNGERNPARHTLGLVLIGDPYLGVDGHVREG